MERVKRHLFIILCAAAIIAGVALAVTGLGAMPKVAEELDKAKQVYDGLSMLQGRPVNAAMIDAEQQRIEEVKSDSDRVLDATTDLYGYEPLVPTALPDGDTESRIQFRRAYAEAMQALFDSLHSGQLATARDVNAMEERMAREALRRSQAAMEADGSLEPLPTGPAETAAGVLTKAGAVGSAAARASIAKALTIYCYANPFTGLKPPDLPSLQFHPAMKDTGMLEPPSPSDVWWAQIQYWIQKDVVEAIVAVNDEAAEQAKERGEDRWVGNMPVKEIISVRVFDMYVIEDDAEYAGSAPGGYQPALPCGTPNTVFTDSRSGDAYDVVHFSLKLMMDQRDVLRLVDRLSKDKFHTLLRAAYKVVPPSRSMVGKVFGAEPTVNVVLDFESIMVSSVFLPLVPEEICEEYDHLTCPDRGTDEEEGE